MMEIKPATLTAHLPLAERLLRTNWLGVLKRSESGTPLLTPAFVAEQGRKVFLIDLRSTEELFGVLGHIPGSYALSKERAPEIFKRLGALTPVILVCQDGVCSGKVAQYLECLGMHFVACLQGGISSWKTLGYATIRDKAILRREILPHPITEAMVEGQKEILSQEAIREHLGDPGAVRWVKLAAFLLHGKRSCVDGRDDQGVIGTPGGDTGEFILALATIERLTKKAIDPVVLPELLTRYMDVFGRFYMHSDVHATNLLIRSMRADPRLTEELKPLDKPHEWRAYTKEPPRAFREAILEHLLMPPHIGCGHLRLMILHPEEYGLRRELVLDVLRAYHRVRWNGQPEMEFVILGGDHFEGAVVNVTIEEELEPFTRIPLISPSCGNAQMFVNHPQVSCFLREQMIFFFLRQTDLLPIDPSQKEALIEELIFLADKQLTTTLGYLAKGLPLYNIHFCDHTDVSVR